MASVAPPSPLLALPGMGDELARVERALRQSVVSEDPHLTELASHLIEAGGKRLRPALAVVVAGCLTGIPVTDEVVLGGVSVELVQVGSLYHDDVMDEATTRRGVESVNARFGNLKAILSGDYLLAKASEIAASLGTEVAGLLANTITRLCEGQVRELRDAYNLSRTDEAYITSINGKTAALLATSCRVGAIVADLPRSIVTTLTEFGHHYGMAFQVVDDILDVVATDEQLGKPAGNDLVEGVYTLPVLRALTAAEPLRSRLGRPIDGDELEVALSLVRSDGAVSRSLDTAREHADDALRALGTLRETDATRWLAEAAGALVDGVIVTR